MRQQAVRHRAIFLSATVCLAWAWLPASAGPAAVATTAASTSAITEPASLAALPAEIREHIGADVSDLGGPFAAGCVSINGEPHRRFVRARIDGDLAHVTIERGGRAHFFEQLNYRRVDGHWVNVPSTFPSAAHLGLQLPSAARPAGWSGQS
jgi:hypothetical protein